MTSATVTIPLIAVIGIVSRNIIRMKANDLPTNPNFLASIGLGLPNHVLNLPTISMFQDAPIILPYARIVGPMKTKPAIASAKGFSDGSIRGTRSKYVPKETPNRPINVPVLLKNNFKTLFFVTPIFFPTNCPFRDSQGDINIGIRTKIPMSNRLGR